MEQYRKDNSVAEINLSEFFPSDENQTTNETEEKTINLSEFFPSDENKEIKPEEKTIDLEKEIGFFDEDECFGEDPDDPSFDVHQNLFVHVFARDREHAIKITNERRTVLIATERWPSTQEEEPK